MNCVILGDRSDIARGLVPLLQADGWNVHGWHRGNSLPSVSWDLMLIAMGTVAPVGLWDEQEEDAWDNCISDNLLLPIAYLRRLWPRRNLKASVCFMAGSNPNMIMNGYSAYNVAKMALLKAVEQMDQESQDAKFFALAPGIVLTKIHDATRAAKWPNPKLEKAGSEAAPHIAIPRIYECLKWCISQPKGVVGGRNICVSDPWDKEEFLASKLALHPSMYKLRRQE